MQKIIIQPYFAENLNFVNSSVETINGTIKVNWQKSDNSLKLNLEIPINSSAEIIIPNLFNNKIFESNLPINNFDEIKIIEENNKFTKLNIESGQYEFIVK